MTDKNRSPTFEARRSQMFPTLTADELARVRAYGVLRRYADGERMLETGTTGAGIFVILSGVLRITGRDGHGHDLPVMEEHAGQFSGEIGQLSGKRSFVDGVAVGNVEALLISPEQIRKLMITEADLGEKIMRALILRRVGLIELGHGGPVLIGDPSSAEVVTLRNFLNRNGIPHLLLDVASDPDAKSLVEDHGALPEQLPLVACPDGSVLKNPTESELARCIGMLDSDRVGDAVHDVVVVGAGPGGLSTAVYAASEGLGVLVIDARAFGGQAGASARIENYLGFPTGISGQALAGRAYTQAQKFGARILIPAEVTLMECERPPDSGAVTLTLADGTSVRGRTVVIATGARYRRPDCGDLRALEGRGVWYWASPIEAKMCAGEDVVLVGGGNSAGQAAVFLAGHAHSVRMLVRGAGLSATMSKYLVDRIASTPNIEVSTRTEIVGVMATNQPHVRAVRLRRRDTGAEETVETRNVFLFLGADPATEWLGKCPVTLDDKGFVATGAHRNATMPVLPLETSVPGVFAVGDVRAGSTKRVGAAIGEGAAVVAQIHEYIARQSPAANAARA